MEKRVMRLPIEVRASKQGGSMMLSGYAATFGSLSSDLGGFKERLLPGCFTKALEKKNTVHFLFNHDQNKILASSDNNSLTLRQDTVGLKFEATLPDTETARECWQLVQGGFIQKCSFAFIVSKGGDSWKDEQGRTVREIREIENK